MKRQKRHRGFTLIEVLITVAVVAILMSIAVPSYQSYIRRGKVPEATSALANARVKYEQYYQDNRTYAIEANNDCSAVITSGVNSYFTYTCSGDNTTYSIKAEGKSGAGLSGYAYTINQKNEKTTTIDGNTYSCWVTKPGESC